MLAEVRALWTDDPPGDCVAMQAEIGPVGEVGAEIFSFSACTAAGLGARLDSAGRPYWARAPLVVPAFTHEAVVEALGQLVRSVSGEDWNELAVKLSRFLQWEFEDYQP